MTTSKDGKFCYHEGFGGPTGGAHVRWENMHAEEWKRVRSVALSCPGLEEIARADKPTKAIADLWLTKKGASCIVANIQKTLAANPGKCEVIEIDNIIWWAVQDAGGKDPKSEVAQYRHFLAEFQRNSVCANIVPKNFETAGYNVASDLEQIRAGVPLGGAPGLATMRNEELANQPTAMTTEGGLSRYNSQNTQSYTLTCKDAGGPTSDPASKMGDRGPVAQGGTGIARGAQQ